MQYPNESSQEPPAAGSGGGGAEGSGSSSSADANPGSTLAGPLTPPPQQAKTEGKDKDTKLPGASPSPVPHAGRREGKPRTTPSAGSGASPRSAGQSHEKKKPATGKKAGQKSSSKGSGGSGRSSAESLNENDDNDDEDEDDEDEDESSSSTSSSDDEHAELPPSAAVRSAKHPPRVGARVKVCFDSHKWYGGVCLTTVQDGKVRIKYDDGNTEEARYPDSDIVVSPWRIFARIVMMPRYERARRAYHASFDNSCL